MVYKCQFRLKNTMQIKHPWAELGPWTANSLCFNGQHFLTSFYLHFQLHTRKSITPKKNQIFFNNKLLLHKIFKIQNIKSMLLKQHCRNYQFCQLRTQCFVGHPTQKHRFNVIQALRGEKNSLKTLNAKQFYYQQLICFEQLLQKMLNKGRELYPLFTNSYSMPIEYELVNSYSNFRHIVGV